MGDRCEVHLVRYDFQPGDTINGKVDCFFSQEQTVRNIELRFKGRAKVRWSQGKSHYEAEELYFNETSNLLSCETKFTPGTYSYPFHFKLPANIPSSICEDEGNIEYKVRAIVDKAWAVDYETKKEFRIIQVMNLNFMEHLREPFVFMKEKVPTSLLPKSGAAITVIVSLPRTGFVPGEMLTFQARIKNNCSFPVKQVIFRIVHGFEFFADGGSKKIISRDCDGQGQYLTIKDGGVPPKSDKTWDLELVVISNVFCSGTEPCSIIRPFCELKGEVCLPLLHRNIKFKIPVVIGMMPFTNS